MLAQLVRKRAVADRAAAIDDAETIRGRRTDPRDSAEGVVLDEHADQVSPVCVS